MICTAVEEKIYVHRSTYCSMLYIFNTSSLGLPIRAAQHPCMCHPWTINGKAHVIHGTSSYRLNTIHAQALGNTTHNGRKVLCSGGPNHSKPLCVLMFLHLHKLTLGCPLVLRIRRVLSTTRLEFTSDI
jgi:hypothetical protein